MRITEEATEAAFAYAKKVYSGEIKRKDALTHLADNYGLNANSAADLVNNFKYMMEGKLYSRTNNEYTTAYYLKNIHAESGQGALKKALNAVAQHIEYYEHSQKITMHKTRAILAKYTEVLGKLGDPIYPDEIINPKEIFEGAKKQITVNAYERNNKARERCIAHYGSSCSVCSFNFTDTFGERGKDFIHVHHLVQLSTIGKEYRVDPIADLRPVCPNCHAMLHRNPLLSIELLKECLSTGGSSKGV